MQQPLNPERCDRCGQPVRPGEPVMRTASVDLDDYGRAVASPVRTVHLDRGCREDGRTPEAA
ncbi:MAG: hypothetical protein F4081_06805 [Dehalococcoidia bacterium]|nr:hypothetical protein [Dehalococcoidia bacterium]MYI86485.1 hypothetical protein [Dehalococcoidia bacterium]